MLCFEGLVGQEMKNKGGTEVPYPGFKTLGILGLTCRLNLSESRLYD